LTNGCILCATAAHWHYYFWSATGNFSLPSVYADAVRQAGGRVILLPPGEVDPKFILDLADGLVFCGGGDIDPATYNGSPHGSIYNVDSERDAFEILARQLLATDIPVLGIWIIALGFGLSPRLSSSFSSFSSTPGT
jgi:gamma-glutamyl-gamma-aminobutyrate hydrolase PuuD